MDIKKCKACGAKLIVPSWVFCDDVFCRGKRELIAYKKRYIPVKLRKQKQATPRT